MKKYTDKHEWIEIKDGVGTVGISRHAADELGDITFLELPEPGLQVSQGDELGIVESVKAASDIFAPIGGIVSEVNRALEDSPQLLNESPEDSAWICRLRDVKSDDLDSLMSGEEYAAFTASS